MKRNHKRIHLIMAAFMIMGLLANVMPAGAALGESSDTELSDGQADSTVEQSEAEGSTTPETTSEPVETEPPPPPATEPSPAETEPSVPSATETEPPVAPTTGPPMKESAEEVSVPATQKADPPTSDEAPGQSIALLAEPVVVVPETPTVTDGACVDGVTQFPTVIFAQTEGVNYYYERAPDPIAGGPFTILAGLASSDGYVWGAIPGDWRTLNDLVIYDGSVAADPCPGVVPVAPTVTQGWCPENGVTRDPSVILATTPDGVTYSFTTSPAPVTGGPFTVQATLGEGYAWSTLPDGWSRVNDTTATYSGSVQANPCGPVVPVSPTVINGACVDGVTHNPTVILASEPVGINYYFQRAPDPIVGGQFTILAGLAFGSGYVWGAIPGDWRTLNGLVIYEGSVAAQPCPGVIPVAPTVIDGACVFSVTQNPTVTLATTPSGVTYSFTQPPDPVTGGPFTVQATLGEGQFWGTLPDEWTQVDESTATYSGSVQANPCIEVVPVDPTVTVGACVNGVTQNPTVTSPSEPDGVIYMFLPPPDPVTGGDFTLLAVIGDRNQYVWGPMPDGWYFANQAAWFESSVQANPCEAVIPVAPTVTDGACLNGITQNPTLVLASSPAGVTYSFTTSPDPVTGGDFTVQAALGEGKAWATLPDGWTQVDDTTATYSGTVVANPCDEVVPDEPTVIDGACVDGVYTAPTVTVTSPDANGVTYAVAGPDDLGDYTVTATLSSDQVWGDLAGTGWEASLDGRTAAYSGTVALDECQSNGGNGGSISIGSDNDQDNDNDNDQNAGSDTDQDADQTGSSDNAQSGGDGTNANESDQANTNGDTSASGASGGAGGDGGDGRAETDVDDVDDGSSVNVGGDQGVTAALIATLIALLLSLFP